MLIPSFSIIRSHKLVKGPYEELWEGNLFDISFKINIVIYIYRVIGLYVMYYCLGHCVILAPCVCMSTPCPPLL